MSWIARALLFNGALIPADIPTNSCVLQVLRTDWQPLKANVVRDKLSARNHDLWIALPLNSLKRFRKYSPTKKYGDNPTHVLAPSGHRLTLAPSVVIFDHMKDELIQQFRSVTN